MRFRALLLLLAVAPAACQVQDSSDDTGGQASGTDTVTTKDGAGQTPETAVGCTSDAECAGQGTVCAPAICKGGGCVAAQADGAPCDDGDPCTSDDSCASGACLGEVVVCDDGDPCTDDSCAATGCVATPRTDCPCKTDVDCNGGSDLCAGVRECVEGTCATVAGSPVGCPDDDDTECLKSTCQPATGECALVPVSEGEVCGEVPCQSAGTCIDGECTDIAPVSCIDDDPCTDDGCDPSTGCTHAPTSGAPCDDGSACTQGDACVGGACVGAAAACDDGDPCTGDACSPDSGCTHPPAGGPCDDDDACTTGDACEAGACVGAAATCNDGDPCTEDACDPTAGCTYVPASGALCDDASACTQGDVCNGGACAGAPVLCDDGNPCTQDGCDPKEGCTFEPQTGAPCDDGSACTAGDSCSAGTCAGAAVACDDGDLCTADTCSPGTGCVHAPLTGAPCDDGSACTAGDACVAGTCAGSVISCDDGDPCTQDGCNSGAGCTHTAASGAPCDDASPCTASDTCMGGECLGVAISCDDGDPCTDDACSTDSGCTHAASSGSPCTDGSACTVGDVCVDGACVGAPVPCDDDDPCTDDVCDQAGGCTHTPDSGAPCNDGSWCTASDTCKEGDCAGVVVACDDHDPCTDDGCSPETGCTHTPSSDKPCDDGSACTDGDSCQAGECAPGTSICPCTTHADCQRYEDGDLCTGTLHCDLDDVTPGCVTDPTTVVSCDASDVPCVENLCDPADGICKFAPASDGAPCSDGSLCEGGSACLDGACIPGAAIPCHDQNPCTEDACDPATGCTHAPAAGPCSDGSLCTVADACQDGACVPGSALTCDDGNVCTVDSCDPAKGCIHAPVEGACSDGSACTSSDACQAGVCVPGAPVGCNDQSPCTSDVCDPATGCVHTPAGGPCDDGTPCTVADACEDGACVPGPPLDCDDENACTVDTCDLAFGCVHTLSGGACEDGSVCTAGDFCKDGGCVSGGVIACDDGDVCTGDSCDPATGCVHAPVEGACSDGSACTVGDACEDGACVSGTAVVCDDGSACTADTCDPVIGCVHTPILGACDDGSACTAGDICQGGICTPGAPVSCEDHKPCTADVCDPATGCVHTPTPGTCDDGSACTAEDTCQDGACVPGAPIACGDDDPCTSDACDPATGCVYGPAPGPCDDGDACTVGDACQGGVCASGSTESCDDSNPCTVDTCDPATGCVHVPVEGACEDGSACTAGDTCQGGSCSPGAAVACDDDQLCTSDACDPATGCAYNPAPGPCDDGSACTAGDACLAGACAPGAAIACDDGLPCTDDGCDPTIGCVHAPTDGMCDDGDACTAGDVCLLGACIAGAPVSCDDGSTCTADSCDPASGCVNAPDHGACDDGDACTVDTCSPLGCQSAPLDCDDGNACTDELGCDAATGCLRENNELVYGACVTGQPGQCGVGTWHCQDGVGYCLPALPGLGDIEDVTVPDGLLERYGGTTAGGEILITSNGEHLVNLAHGVGGEAYAGWTWRLIDPRNGFATVHELSLPDAAFYANGVVADATHLYAIQWTGAGYGRVRAISLATGEIVDAGTPLGDWSIPQAAPANPISGQYDWANGQVFLGDLTAPNAYRWVAPWQPLHTPPPYGNADEVITLQGVVGAGVVATDGTWLYVKRWSGYPGDDELRRLGSGFRGTTAGAYGGRVTLSGPLGPSLTAAFHSDGYVYNARYDGQGLQRVRVSAASPEVCDGLDNDCDGSIDEACHPGNDHCIHATEAGDGPSSLDTTGATSGALAGCGGAPIEADIWVRYTATCNGVVKASLCTGHEGVVAVYAGTACPPGPTTSCGAAPCEGQGLTFNALAGQEFLLRIGGETATDVGPSTLTLSCGTSCGDGVVDPESGEECDDGGHFTNDGCNATCLLESCGDGIVQDMLYEACDDGPDNSDSVPGACRTNCLRGDCGDGVVDGTEECDLGTANSNTAKDGCRSSCANAYCGDGVVDTGEACDDGNKDSGDGCSPACVLEVCGDGAVTGAETCDDGNEASGDGCSAECQDELCGDGVLQVTLDEQCDAGKNGSATCTDTCKTIACGAEVCDGKDNDCDGVVDEGCDSSVVPYVLAADAHLADPPLQVKVLPTACDNVFDCNDENTYTTDACVDGACQWTYTPCDGPDADSCPDGRHVSQLSGCTDTGPTLLWDFEEPLDGAVLDLSGNGAHGIPSGGAIDPAGKHGKAFSTGGTGHVHKPTLLPTTDFTFTAWFKTTAATGGILAAVGPGPIGDAGTPTDRELYLSGGKLAYRVWPGASSTCTGQGPAVNDGAWHHAALVCRKGISCRLLVDGAQICESLYFDAESKLANQTAFVAGWSQAGGGFTGQLDHVALFGYPMTQKDVAHLMANGILTADAGNNMERCNGQDMDCNGAVDDTCTNTDLCSPTDTCNEASECVAATTTTCSGPSTACSADLCTKATGICEITNKAAGTSCNDDSACTSADVCDGNGKCAGSNTNCGSGTAWFPAGVVRDDGKDLGTDIIIYDMKGAPKLGCIIPMANELGAFGTWKLVQGTSDSYYHQGPVGYGIAAPKAGNKYVCSDIWWVLTTDLTVRLDPFSMGGKITVPFPDVGFSKDIALSPPPISVNAPYLALGVQSGASLSYLHAPLQPDRDYWFLSGLLGAHLTLGSALPIPFPGSKSVSIVIDPFDPLFYLGLEGLVEIPVTPVNTVSLEAIGFSNGGKLLHSSFVDMWFGKTKTGDDQLTKLVFDKVSNNAHGYVQAGVGFKSAAVPDVDFKITGQVSVGLDAKGDGFSDTGGADTIWNAMIAGAPAGNDNQKDVRTLIVGNLAFKMPLKRKNKDGESVPILLKFNGKESPLALGFALAQAALLFDTSPGDEVVALRARTTKMPWESVPVLKDLLASFNFKLDVAGYWKRLGTENSGGFAIEVVTPTPIKLPKLNRAIPFRGLFVIDSLYGIKLQGSFDLGKFSWFGADFDMGTVGPVEASYDGEKFCLGVAVTVPKSVKKEGGGTENTTCSIIPCFGENGFDGTKIKCDPLCFSHAECDDSQRCIWGSCKAPLVNGSACSDDQACKSGRCFSGFCVECWPGSSECSGTNFCDEAGYCQGQLDNGALCVSFHSGVAFSRHAWCKSGKCDTQCVECLPRGPLHEPLGPFPYTETCPTGKFCDGLGTCQTLLPGGATCLNVKQAMGVDAWCEYGDCNDVTAICQDCGPDTSNTCDANHYCLGYGCQPKVGDDTACLLPEACKSGTCGVGVVAGTGTWCYTANSKSYDEACKVSAACKSGGCRLTDNKCGCNGNHGLCNTSTQYCDVGSTCQPKKPNSVLSVCTADVECTSGHCSGICVECQSHSHCTSDQFCSSSSTCQAKKPNGAQSPCVADLECTSGHCSGICVQCQGHDHCGPGQWCDSSSVCQSKKEAGELCLSNAECSGGLCTAGYCGECASDAHCGDGKFCAAWVCYDKKAFGSECAADAECSTGYCSFFTCSYCKGANTGCGGGQFCDGANCQSKKGYGSGCGSGAECQSGQCSVTFTCGCASNGGYCSGSQYCDGTYCQWKKSSGSLCGSSSECSSNNCKWNGIVNACGCGGDGDCASTDFCNGNGDCQADLVWPAACSRSAQCGAGTYCKNHPYNCGSGYNCNPHDCCDFGFYCGCIGSVCTVPCCKYYTCYDTCYSSCDDYYCDY